jgi:hypothetical protein
MASSADSVFVVNSVGIAAMMGPSGAVGRWMGRKSQEITLRARRYVGHRTGSLAASIHTTGLKHNLPTHCSFEVTAGAFNDEGENYALFHHEGTKTPIKSRRAPYMAMDKNGNMRLVKPAMRVRPAPYSWYAEPTMRKSVRGRRANRFLRNALTRSLRKEVPMGS